MSKFFTDDELSCNCGCGDFEMDEEFMNLLHQTRLSYDKPMVLSSAKRCKDHNVRVGGSASSAHLEGKAVDVLVSGKDAMELLKIASLYFGGIGLKQNGPHNSRFLHLDNAAELSQRPRPWIWTY